jgi:hypothetical protein
MIVPTTCSPKLVRLILFIILAEIVLIGAAVAVAVVV